MVQRRSQRAARQKDQAPASVSALLMRHHDQSHVTKSAANTITPDAAVALAHDLVRSGNRTRAEAVCRQVVDQVPRHSGARHLLLRLLAAARRNDDLIRLAVTSLDIDPEDAEYRATFLSAFKGTAYDSTAWPAEFAASVRQSLCRCLEERWIGAVNLADQASEMIGHDHALPALAAVSADTGRADIDRFMADRLVQALLWQGSVPVRSMEPAVVAVRRLCLNSVVTEPFGLWQPDLRFCAGLACSAFFGEYAWAESDEETAQVAELARRIERELGDRRKPRPLDVVLLGSYRPLHSLSVASALEAVKGPRFVDAVIDLQVVEPLAERALAAEMPRLTAIRDEVSDRVREQYEANPYPRWMASRVHLGVIASSAAAWVTAVTGVPVDDRHIDGKAPAALIAGCGTGQQVAYVADQLPGAKITALDLSCASLAYARRVTTPLWGERIHYVQGDILELGDRPERYDVIFCTGVLHHLAVPETGLAILTSLLKPGGFMRLGLYSEAARQDIVAGHALIREHGWPTTPAGIRAARAHILALPSNHPATALCRRRDFRSMTGVRDLLFHVQEHRFTIDRLDESLTRAGLRFVGMTADMHIIKAFTDRFGPLATSQTLANWKAFEADHPRTFAGMYQFWCQKPA